MTKKGGKKYRCYLPEAEQEGETVPDGGPLEPAQSVATYLLPIKGTCFYRLEGWWTYEFCFMKSVRQFHQEKFKNAQKEDVTQITQDNTLGAYWTDKDEPANAIRGELLDDPKTKRKYWRQFYGNGTLCDLTGKPRESEVRLQCAPGEPSYLASIEETSTCKYLVQFSSNLLCKHPAFAADKKKETVEAIQCEPLDAAGHPLPPPKRAPSAPSEAGGAAAAAEGTGGAAGAAGSAAAGSAAAPVEAKPSEVAFGLGQCLLHRRYSYRGVIVGYDKTCQQARYSTPLPTLPTPPLHLNPDHARCSPPLASPVGGVDPLDERRRARARPQPALLPRAARHPRPAGRAAHVRGAGEHPAGHALRAAAAPDGQRDVRGVRPGKGPLRAERAAPLAVRVGGARSVITISLD